jgi:hypothetical protein
MYARACTYFIVVHARIFYCSTKVLLFSESAKESAYMITAITVTPVIYFCTC